MKWRLAVTIMCICPYYIFAQPANRPKGTFTMRATANSASLNVTVLSGQTVNMTGENEYNAGKIYPQYYKLIVTDDQPWVVTVRSVSPYFTATVRKGSANIPAEIISLKDSRSPDYIHLSATPQALLTGDGATPGDVFFLDLKIDPSWNYSGGSYNQQIVFTLSPQ